MDPNDPSECQLELDDRRITADEKRLEAEIKQKKEELALQKLQVGRYWITPITTLVAAFIGFGGIWIQFEGSRRDNRRINQGQLIETAIKEAGTPKLARANLHFLSTAGLIPDYKDRLETAVSRYQRTGSPQFPYSGTYHPVNSHPAEKNSNGIGNAFCELQIFTNDARGQYSGAGFLIAPHIVLTVAENLHDPRRGFDMTTAKRMPRVGVYIGGSSTKIDAEKLYVPAAWLESSSEGSNYGCVILPTSVPGAQPVELAVISPENERIEFGIFGYKGDELLAKVGQPTEITEDSISFANPFGRALVGSPILIKLNEGYAAVGIQTSVAGRGLRLTDETIDDLLSKLPQRISSQSGRARD